ncbi:MAG: hypothetical protein JNK67_13005 [Alphaproteobacteria bacterium]|nr:hypothetical protein [Alphaproteobacteria bacterium]
MLTPVSARPCYSWSMVQIENCWWESRKLLDFAHAIRVATFADEFLCEPAYKKVREAIVAAEFATRRPWNRDWQVRPVPEDERFPDAELKCGDDVYPFEIVEADRENRRRCDEYRAAKSLPCQCEHYDPDEEANTALKEIRRVVEQKAAKLYSPKPHLLVYVNFSGGEPTSLYAAGLQDLFGTRFQSAWLLWQKGTFRLWPNPAKIKVG